MRSWMRCTASLMLALALPLAGCGNVATAVGKQRVVSSKIKAKVHEASELSLIVQPEAGSTPIVQAIDAATASVWLQIYMLTDPAVIEALGRAAARGLEVRVLLEENPYNPGNPNAALSGNQEIARHLTALGVTVLWSNPQFNFTHAKTMIVDGATAYVLTYNLTKAATEDNREFGMVNRSPSDVEELKRIFLADWNRQSYRPIDPDLVVSPDNARWRILGLMEQAQSELWVGVEVISDPEAMAILVEKKKAGVDVRLLIGGVKKMTANYAPMKYLVENGVPTRSQARPYLHAKYAIADGKAAYIGSINLSTNSLDENRELGMLVDSPETCEALRAVWQNDWNRSETFETIQVKMAK